LANGRKASTYQPDHSTDGGRGFGPPRKFPFDMGGAGDLLSLSLSVPPWEDLHELSREELRRTNLVTTDTVDPPGNPNAAVAELTPNPVQERVASSVGAPAAKHEQAKTT